MLGLYFSGTGNTKYCVEYFVKQMNDSDYSISIENANVIQEIASHDTLVLGYPIYFSNAPKIVRDFIVDNHICFKGKNIYIIATMGLFSGDGTGCTARMLRKYQANILAGLHLKMPDCIGDEKALKRTAEANNAIILKAEAKIRSSVLRIGEGKAHKEGLGFLHHMAGLFGQRLWFYHKTSTYKQKPNINIGKCIGCGRCASLCPMNNISIADGKAVSNNQCTLCYRCFSQCPTQALTILGRQVYEQCLFDRYK